MEQHLAHAEALCSPEHRIREESERGRGGKGEDEDDEADEGDDEEAEEEEEWQEREVSWEVSRVS